ncbi:MAG: serine hydrolase [bacterium]|nr:serine hydrolase [bacterium]
MMNISKNAIIKNKLLHLSAISLLIIPVLFSCTISTAQESSYTYTPPVQIDDGWKTGSLSSVGIDIKDIELITNRLINEERFEDLLSYLIIKDGKLVHEYYSKYCQRNTLFWMASITKAFTSTLIGIAIDEGFIKDENESLVALLPEYSGLVKDSRMNEVRLKHIMSMCSGLDWTENVSYNNPRNSEFQMVDSPDWFEYVITKSVIRTPGEHFSYNTGGIHLLSAVIKSTTGLLANEFAEKYLLHPMGVFAYQWNRDSKGYSCTGGTDGGIGLRSRDLAKFGWLFFKDGTWNGNQIISKGWIEKATKGRFNRGSTSMYGYNWSSGYKYIKGKKIEYVAAFGYGGQTLYLVPELDMILVLTAELAGGNAGVNIPVQKTFEAVVKK